MSEVIYFPFPAPTHTPQKVTWTCWSRKIHSANWSFPPLQKNLLGLERHWILARQKQKETFKGDDKVTSGPVKWSRESILWDVFHMMESRFMALIQEETNRVIYGHAAPFSAGILGFGFTEAAFTLNTKHWCHHGCSLTGAERFLSPLSFCCNLVVFNLVLQHKQGQNVCCTQTIYRCIKEVKSEASAEGQKWRKATRNWLLYASLDFF